MSYIHIPSGSPLNLELSLADGHTGRFPRAKVYVSGTSTQIAGSPVTLSHSAGGRYLGSIAATPGRYTAVFETYADAGHGVRLFKYGQPTDNFEVDTALADLVAIKAKTDQFSFTGGNVNIHLSATQIASIVDSVWDEALSGHLTPGSTGEALSDASGASSTTLTLQDLNDIADAVWDEIRSGHTTPGTFGEVVDSKISSRASQTSLDAAKTAILSAVVDRDIIMTTAINPTSDVIEFQVWLIEDGITATNTDSAALEVRDGDGALIFSIATVTTSTNGVFKLTRGSASAVLAANRTYHVITTIVRSPNTYKSTKSFTVF